MKKRAAPEGRARFFWGSLHEFRHGEDRGGGAFGAGGLGVDAKVIGFGFAPGAAGVVAVVVGAAFVDAVDVVFGFFFGEALTLCDPRDSGFQGGVEEDFEAAGLGPQDIVRAAADDDAGFRGREATDDGSLGEEGLVAHGDVVLVEEIAAACDGCGGEIEEKAGGGLFFGFFDELGGEAALFGGELEEGFVVTGDAETLGDGCADFAASAAVLAADGDD